jgi:uncharacterized protein (DUF1697 family)
MASVVFLRGVNVGKHNRCQPAALAKELSKFGVLNIGAVGTFVVRQDASEGALRAAIAKKLPFKCEMMICPAKAILDLFQENPFGDNTGDNIEAYVTVMAKRPANLPKLPIYAPSEEKWEIKVVRVIGTAVLSLRRRLKDGRFYPNEIIEKKFGIPATTRNWNTILKVSKILESG